MTLKDTIISALRLGPSSANALSEEINRNIITAQAEMIRLGVSDELAKSTHPLIEDAIVTFVMMKMGDVKRYEQYQNGWEYQVDCIRKSKLVPPEGGGNV